MVDSHTIMGSEAEKDSIHAPKLPLFSPPQAHMQSPERSGMSSPPSQTSASVPFRWEDEPGKPKPCTTLTIFSSDLAAKCLELPPRLLHDAKNLPVSKSARFQSSSSSSSSSPFRIGSECYGSFRAFSVSPENVRLGSSMVISKRGSTYKEKGLFGSWKRRAFKARDSDVFPSFGDRDSECSTKEDASVKITRTKRVHSLFHSKSKFWASIYQGLKLAVPWSKRGNKNGYMSSRANI